MVTTIEEDNLEKSDSSDYEYPDLPPGQYHFLAKLARFEGEETFGIIFGSEQHRDKYLSNPDNHSHQETWMIGVWDVIDDEIIDIKFISDHKLLHTMVKMRPVLKWSKYD